MARPTYVNNEVCPSVDVALSLEFGQPISNDRARKGLAVFMKKDPQRGILFSKELVAIYIKLPKLALFC